VYAAICHAIFASIKTHQRYSSGFWFENAVRFLSTLRRRQALLPASSTPNENHCGSASSRLLDAWKSSQMKIQETTKLVRVEQLKKDFPLESGMIWHRNPKMISALDNLSFDIFKGETLAVVGESGCGKTTLGRTILQICKPTSGKVFFDDIELTRLSPEKIRPLRTRMQMIFQNPANSLNPRMTIGEIISEGLVIQNLLAGSSLDDRVNELMNLVGLNPILKNRYPHEFSTGQLQRVGIARAISLNPDFIICDEPITSLDVSIQAQIVNLLMNLQTQFGLTYLYISHDLSMVHYISNRVAVMYLGKFMEIGKTEILFSQPIHPYTQALLTSMGSPKPRVKKKPGMVAILGEKPSPDTKLLGCKFCTQCPIALELCNHTEPSFKQVADGHYAACHRS
jgi:oligopeptide transport system ATP-binding protein